MPVRVVVAALGVVLVAAGVSVAEKAFCWRTNCSTTMVVILLPPCYPLVVVAEVAPYLRLFELAGSVFRIVLVGSLPEWLPRWGPLVYVVALGFPYPYPYPL